MTDTTPATADLPPPRGTGVPPASPSSSSASPARPFPRRRPPLRGPLAIAASRVYSLAVERRNRRFDSGRGVITLPVPVISVGNLTVGGTGKTPMVRFITRALLDAGFHPCIAMRGYKSRGGASDEQLEHERAFAGSAGGRPVPVVARPDRAAGIAELLASGAPVGCVVLDDGFQHRRIDRQMDVVLIDASADSLDDRLLPAGWLREPADNLSRATHIAITHAELADDDLIASITARAHSLAPHAPVAVTRHKWSSVAVTGPHGEREEETPWLGDRAVIAACAIGNPLAFLAAAHSECAGVAGQLVLPDHHVFGPRELARILALASSAGARVLLTTEKDWTKLAWARGQLVAAGIDVARPRLALAFERGEAELVAAAVDLARLGTS